MLREIALAALTVAAAPASGSWEFVRTDREIRLEGHANSQRSEVGILFFCLPVGGNSLRQAMLSLPPGDNDEVGAGEVAYVYADGQPLLKAIAQATQPAASFMGPFDLAQLAKQFDTEGIAELEVQVEGRPSVGMTIGTTGFQPSFAKFRSACEEQVSPTP